MSEVNRGSFVQRAVFERAVRIGKEFVRTGRPTLAHRAADRLVFRKIRERLGGRIRVFISGGAALEKEIGEFFLAVGLPILEGYGLTETSPVITLTAPGEVRIGFVGRCVGDVEVKLAPDGEICVRGSNVMKGYYHNQHETDQVLRGGWFHTGDIGVIDSDGFLRITDRKKDLIVMSNGKNVAPQPVETRLRLIPYFENVVVIGDGRNFISALIVPNYDALVVYARSHGIVVETPAELIETPEIHDLAMKEIEAQTEDLAPFEKIRKIAFLKKPFTIYGGELTPTLKVRRTAIEAKYKAVIDGLYVVE
jgi:long-chain acyl-CoA synthetase